MPEKIDWTLNVQVSGGPKVTISQTIVIEAYDSIKVTVLGGGEDLSGGDENKEIQVLPSGSGQVRFFVITSDRYDADLTYKVNEAASEPVALDRPHILAGQGAVSLLDPAAAPTSLFFSSGIAENAEIHILVGRDAIPTP